MEFQKNTHRVPAYKITWNAAEKLGEEGGEKQSHQSIQAFHHPNSICRDVELFQLHQSIQTLQLRDSVVLVRGRV